MKTASRLTGLLRYLNVQKLNSCGVPQKKEVARIKPQKANRITNGADVAQLVGWKKEKATAPKRQLFVRLNDKEQQIVKHMSATPKHISLINLDASLKILMFQGSFFNLK